MIAQSVWHCATGCTIWVLGFDSRQWLGIILFTTVSRAALGPIFLSNGYQGLFPWGKAARA
jgi:hypothetical protein